MDMFSSLINTTRGLPVKESASVLFHAPVTSAATAEKGNANSAIKSNAVFFIGMITLCLLAVLLVTPATAYAGADTDFVSKLVKDFYTKTSAWEPTLRKYALLIFRWLLILEVCFLGIKAALNRDQVADIFKQFVMLLLTAGFFLAVINNYQEWSWNLIDGLKSIGMQLNASEIASDSPFLAGMKLVKLILSKLSVWSPGNSIALLVAALVIIVCFALISAQVVLIKCEAMIAMMAALLLVGFGGSTFLREYAINAIRYVLSVAFKLFVMQLVLTVGVRFIETFNTAAAELQDIFVIIGASVVLLALVKSLPDVVSGIIHGSHVNGGNLLGAAAAVGGTALAAGALAVGGARNIQNVKDAAKIANTEGKSGWGKLASIAGTMAGARTDAKTDGERSIGSRTRSEMQERVQKASMVPGEKQKKGGE